MRSLSTAIHSPWAHLNPSRILNILVVVNFATVILVSNNDFLRLCLGVYTSDCTVVKCTATMLKHSRLCISSALFTFEVKAQ
jgi:hypothetical protein